MKTKPLIIFFSILALWATSNAWSFNFRFGMSKAVKERAKELDKAVVVANNAVNLNPSTIPTNLGLPITVNNLSATYDPFGIVRFSLDIGAFGHSGIDLHIPTGSNLFAVKDGIVVSITPHDGKEGNQLLLLFGNDNSKGEGWGFIYESVSPASGIAVNSVVTKGQVIATDAGSSGSNHLQLTYLFNNFTFFQTHTCWVSQLGTSENATLTNYFNNNIKNNANLTSYFNTNTRESMLPFQQLLNTTLYPDGPQLCYDPGTDVRVTP